jgi:hypothetical protein
MTTNPVSTNPGSSNFGSPNPGPSAPRSPWPYVAATVIGLLGLAWYVSSHSEDDGTQLAAAPAFQTGETVGRRPPDLTVADVRMELYSAISAVRVTLQAMTNPATTRTYLPQLQQAAQRLDRVNDLVERLPPEARRGMAVSLAPTMRPLNQMFDRVLAMPGVADTARPTIDQVRTTLDALTRA